MLPSVLALLLLAAPQAPARAERLTFIPRLDGLRAGLPFFEAAGSHTALLRPETWRREALPLLGVDVTRRDSVEGAGLDASGPLTVSRVEQHSLSCLKVADARRFGARVDAALKPLGTRFTLVRSGVTIVAARDALGRVLGAVGTLGASACSLAGEGRTVEPLFPALVQALTAPPSGPGLALAATVPGLAQLIIPRGPTPLAVGLTATALTATLGLRAQGLAVPALLGGGPSPYAALTSPGLVVARARFDPAAMATVVARLARELPSGEALAEVAPRLAPLLTGHAVALAWEVRVTRGLRTRPARFFALRLALAAQTRDPAAAQALLAGIDPARLTRPEGRLTLAVVGDSVVLSNDDEARRRLEAALPSGAGTQAHGLEVVADPPRLADALAQVPLLEVVQTPELAGVLAVSAELGPLLLASRSAAFWLDAVGRTGHQGQLTWALDPAEFPLDGGVP
jgi:hypothetical protein